MATKEELKTRLVTGHVVTEKDFHDLIDVAGEKGDTGPKGEPGVDGAKGDKGEPGTNGKDGFGTEAQYNDIISRLEALEGAGS